MAAFAVVEGFRCGTAAALLPAAVAWDVIWPAYTAQLYATITTDLYPWQMPWRYIVIRRPVADTGYCLRSHRDGSRRTPWSGGHP